MEDLKKKILQQVYNSFVNSSGYNGCPAYDLGWRLSNKNSKRNIAIIKGIVANSKT